MDSGKKVGLYSSQDLGLGKELARRGHEVTIYRCTSSNAKPNGLMVHIENGLQVRYQQTRNIGNNTLTRFTWLDKNLDLIVAFSDIQPSIPALAKWCSSNRVKFIPYVGILNSTNRNLVVRKIMNLLSKRTISVYRQHKVLVKTHYVEDGLRARHVDHIKVAPVGLDLDRLHMDYLNEKKKDLRIRLSLPTDSKLILMVGRLESDRNPLDCAGVFKKIQEAEINCHLIIIGKGELKSELFQKLGRALENTTYIESVPNDQMWKYYCAADLLVSFSRTEIFGMSILESMFYELPVAAMHAPGPNDIITHGENGYLLKKPDEIVQILQDNKFQVLGRAAHLRVLNKFTWATTAQIIEDMI